MEDKVITRFLNYVRELLGLSPRTMCMEFAFMAKGSDCTVVVGGSRNI